MFCDQFNTIEEANSNFPNKKCENCNKYSYSQGMVTCEKMEESIMQKGGADK